MVARTTREITDTRFSDSRIPFVFRDIALPIKTPDPTLCSKRGIVVVRIKLDALSRAVVNCYFGTLHMA